MNFKDSRVLITGGAGFIGANLAKVLLKEGTKITIFDDFSTGSLWNIREILNYVTVVEGDVRDFESVKKAAVDQDFVFHMAANASVPISTKNPRYDFEVNALGTLNVLEALLDLDSNAPLVFASSAAVYGEPESVPIQEEYPLRPASPYGTSKLAGEVLCRTFCRVYGLPTVCLRYFNVYGPLQRKYVMFDIMGKLRKRHDRLEVLGTGDQIRDFIHVSDAIAVSLLLARIPSAFGEVYNVGTGIETTIREIVNLILQVVGLQHKTRIFYTNESWKGDVQKLVGDVTKIKEYGFRPKIELKTGLTRFIHWYNTSYLQGQGNV